VAKPPAETELYAPVRDYLLAQGYTVRGEVGGCDLTAVKGDDLVIVELKVRANLALLVQAAHRQRAADAVYVALPRPAKPSREWRGLRHLLRRLEIGLLLVSQDAPRRRVEIAFHPLPYTRQRRAPQRRAILREMAGRSGDYNEGGSSRRKLMTAYRENAIHIACCLERFGPLTPAQLRALGTGQKTLGIVSRNVYGWFARVDRGLYALAAACEMAAFPEVAAQYRATVAAGLAPTSVERKNNTAERTRKCR
jgi:hypothetical protein